MAKLASVRSAWKNILYDAVQSQPHHTYTLAMSLWDGTNGLRPHRSRAIQLLQQMTRQPIHPTTHMPVFTIPNNNSNNQHTNQLSLLQQEQQHQKIPHSLSSSSTASTKEDEDYRVRAMKQLAYLYLDCPDEIPEIPHSSDREEDDDATPLVEVTATNSSNKATQQQQQQQIGMQWLLCAYHVGKDVDAAYEIATIYECGTYSNSNNNNSIPTDMERAIHYFQQAAHNHHVEAMVELALCYELGCSSVMEVNTELSLYWYHRAASLGHVTAKYSIGEAYEQGTMVLHHPHFNSHHDSSSLGPIQPQLTLACQYYYEAAMENDDDSILALYRLLDIARIVIPGIREFLIEKERILTND
jgi:TPR repeat protein